MKYAKQDLPVILDNEDLKVGYASIGGGMTVNYERYHQKFDLAPFFKNTKDNACQVAHWIYVIEGEFSCEYSDGTTERYVAGDVVYTPAPHKPIMGGNCRVICFGREIEVERQRKLIGLSQSGSAVPDRITAELEQQEKAFQDNALKPKKYAKQDLPVILDNEVFTIRSAEIGGGMWVNYEQYHREVDLVPYFKDYEDCQCHVPHWIYIIEGEFSCEYPDGTTEKYVAGDVLYTPAPHKPVMGANCRLISFNPKKETEKQRKHIKLYKEQ